MGSAGHTSCSQRWEANGEWSFPMAAPGAWSSPEPNLQSAGLQEGKFGLEEARFSKENNVNLYFQFSLSRKKISSWEDFDPMDVSPLPMYGWYFMGH